MVASKVAFFGLCRRDCMKLRSGLRLLYIGARIKSSSDKAEFSRNRGAICTFTRRGRCMQVRRLSAREGPISIKDLFYCSLDTALVAPLNGARSLVSVARQYGEAP